MLAACDSEIDIVKHHGIAASDVDVLHVEKFRLVLRRIGQRDHSHLLIK
jgi:hypothetical protein